jgi:hypothetical protein
VAGDGAGAAVTAPDLSPFTDRCLVAFMPCGCWFAVQMQAKDLGERGKRVAQFMRDVAREKAERVDEMTVDEFRALRNGVNGDQTWGCDHEPQWGGVESDWDDCPRCLKTVKKRKDGRLYSHTENGWLVCSQEPLTAGSAK